MAGRTLELELYLGNLPFDVDEAVVSTTMSAHGAVDWVRVPREPVTGRGRGTVLYDTLTGLARLEHFGLRFKSLGGFWI